MQNDFLSSMTGNSRQVILPQEMITILFLLFFSRFSVLLAYEQAILLLDRLIRFKSFFPFPSSLHTLSASPFSVGIIKRNTIPVDQEIYSRHDIIRKT